MDIQLHAIEKGTGQPLVMLHGNGESSEYFRRQIDFFALHYRVLAVDTRGHGRSPRGTGPFTLERFADDLNNFLNSRHISKAHILGFSDGGNVAILFALKHPDRVGSLILNGANLNPFGLKMHVLLPICLEWFIVTLHTLFDKSAVHEKELLTLMLAEPRISASALSHIKSPVLVIAGSNDMIRARHTEKIYSKLQNAQIAILNGTHFIALENSNGFNDAVLCFLDDTIVF